MWQSLKLTAVFISLLSGCITYAQQGNEKNAARSVALSGTWYLKARDYTFAQDGPATIYSREPISGANAKLSITPQLQYRYHVVQGDSMEVSGRISFQGDTMIFHALKSSHKIVIQQMPHYLYRLDSSELIYSYYQVSAEKPSASGELFERVEVMPVYADGTHSFFKEIYKALNACASDKSDTASLHSFSIRIGAEGEPDLSSLKIIKGNPSYIPCIRQAFQRLPEKFTPGRQNGKNVAATWQFNVNY